MEELLIPRTYTIPTVWATSGGNYDHFGEGTAGINQMSDLGVLWL
jgi:hypothetical protein